MPSIYFWLMSEILFFYCLTAFIICYFFRRFCQDPATKAALEEEEKEELEEEMAELAKDEGGTDVGAKKGAKTKGKASLDNVPTDDGADDEAPAKPNKTKKAAIPKK